MGPGAGHPETVVGRESELDAARRALARRAGGVLLAGEPGVGKTCIARVLVAELEAGAENEVLWMVAPAPEPVIPFGVFAPLVPGVGGKPGRQPDAFFLLQALRRAVLERAGGRRLVLGIDDAHRLDSHSATLVFQLVAAGEALLVAAMRSGSLPAAAVRSLWKEGLVSRIDVEPLSRDDAVDLVRTVLAGAGEPALLGGELAEALWRTSGGNPLYLRELALAGSRSGRIALREGVWRLSGDLPVGPRLAELLQDRLEQLSASERAALEIVAFAAPIPLRVLSRLAPAQDVAALQEAGLLKAERSRGEQTVQAAHPLYAEVVRSAIPAARAGELGLSLADAFEADGRTSTELLRVVSWRLDGGAPPPAAQLVDASVRAAERQDWELSRRLAGAAVVAGGGSEAVFALADSLRTLGRFEEALEALGPREGEGDDQVARVAVLRAFTLFLGLGRLEEAEAALARASSRIADPSLVAWLEAAGAAFVALAGRPGEALAMARPLVGRAGADQRAEVTARAALGLASSLSGLAEQAVALTDGQLDDSGLEAGGWVPVLWVVAARALSFRLSGQVGELEELAGREYRLAVQLGNPYGRGQGACGLGWAALMRGRLEEAASRFREAATDSGAGPMLDGRVESLAGLAEALAVAGDAEAARSALAAARREAARRRDPTPTCAIASAWVAAAEGARSAALADLDGAAGLARQRGQTAMELLALHAAVRLGSPDVAARTAVLAERCEGRLVEVVAAHAAALAAKSQCAARAGAGQGALLDAVAERYASMSLDLYAAEASAQASFHHNAAGSARPAVASAGRVRSLLGTAPQAGPALVPALTPPALTRREAEVAALAARGLSSQDIASRLSISVRTVDTHLARVYFKLGVGGRGDLPGALSSGPDAP